jgi:protein TonB
MSGAMAVPTFGMPWDVVGQDVRRFKGWLRGCLVAVVCVGLIMPWLTVPEIDRAEKEALPPALARILLEKPKLPPPPPKPEIKQEVKPEKVKPVKKKPVVKPRPIARIEPPRPDVAQAQEKAKVSGLLAFSDAFSDMREAVDVSKLQDTGAIQQGAGEAKSIDRSLLTSKHSSRSAGVNVAALSSDTGGVALSGRETTKVEVPQGTTGKGRVKKVKQPIDARQRSVEEIRRVFDSNKGAIFAIYNRALRTDPTLQGKVLLALVIDPNGRVVDCKVVASELADEAVIAKLVKRVRMFNFGKQDVRETKINYPVHFLPT